ncbi:MAG: hypothetical protein DCF31_14850 [Alphaproteobacteria bacterium]|nr:MAG: hypothetical protein DCF31_14850 [Alphaproteobacteria bacterium]
MPSMTMAEQTDNSCAAHCHVIAIAEMLGTGRNMTPAYAEGVVWPAIQFRTGENQGLTDDLATAKNADPRKVATILSTPR